MRRQDGERADSQIPTLPGRIASLDVVVRPAKRTGRGLKQVKDSPVKAMAAALGLCAHERDSFTGWQVRNVSSCEILFFCPPSLPPSLPDLT